MPRDDRTAACLVVAGLALTGRQRGLLVRLSLRHASLRNDGLAARGWWRPILPAARLGATAALQRRAVAREGRLDIAGGGRGSRTAPASHRYPAAAQELDVRTHGALHAWRAVCDWRVAAEARMARRKPRSAPTPIRSTRAAHSRHGG